MWLSTCAAVNHMYMCVYTTAITYPEHDRKMTVTRTFHEFSQHLAAMDPG